MLITLFLAIVDKSGCTQISELLQYLQTNPVSLNKSPHPVQFHIFSAKTCFSPAGKITERKP